MGRGGGGWGLEEVGVGAQMQRLYLAFSGGAVDVDESAEWEFSW